ncbi:MAG: mismatch-specific DNA-glycosylase [Solirubrobacteraceae bacterium]
MVAPGLEVLFCAINPGLASARAGHHFAHPSNRFWKALHLSGFTPELLVPEKDCGLLAYGLEVTNLVDRTTPSAADLQREELRRGRRRHQGWRSSLAARRSRRPVFEGCVRPERHAAVPARSRNGET